MLTDLMERGARLIAANPHLNKTEAARRIGCSRRQILNWMTNDSFVTRLEELKAAFPIDVSTLAKEMPTRDRLELIKRLRDEIGTRTPEIEEIETLILDENGNPDIDLVQFTKDALYNVLATDKKIEPVQREEVERLENLLDIRSPGWREQRNPHHRRTNWNADLPTSRAELYSEEVEGEDAWDEPSTDYWEPDGNSSVS